MKGNLLIVDDEALLIKWLRSSLSDLADEIYVAKNGLEALEIVEREDIHCIVCDVNMPKMNGVEVIKRLRDKNDDVPFIFYTGHGNQELMLEAAKYGAFDFLNKPSLEGMEEVVTRGLRTGLELEHNPPTDFNSEYSKLLEEISKLK